MPTLVKLTTQFYFSKSALQLNAKKITCGFYSELYAAVILWPTTARGVLWSLWGCQATAVTLGSYYRSGSDHPSGKSGKCQVGRPKWATAVNVETAHLNMVPKLSIGYRPTLRQVLQCWLSSPSPSPSSVSIHHVMSDVKLEINEIQAERVKQLK